MTEHILFEGTGAEGWRWTHMLRGPEAEAAMYADPDIPDAAAGALLEEDTLPRSSQIEGGTLLNLRGVNLVPGADPEDMVSLRLWITPQRIVSTEVRRLTQTDQMIAEFRAGKAPDSPGTFIVEMVESLRAAAEPVLDDVEDRVSAMEALVAGPGRRAGITERGPLAGLRQDAIACVRLAIAMRKKLRELASAWASRGLGTQLCPRTGIHPGYCTVGTFGCEDRMDCTIIGGAGILASRLDRRCTSGTATVPALGSDCTKSVTVWPFSGFAPASGTCRSIRPNSDLRGAGLPGRSCALSPRPARAFLASLTLIPASRGRTGADRAPPPSQRGETVPLARLTT